MKQWHSLVMLEQALGQREPSVRAGRSHPVLLCSSPHLWGTCQRTAAHRQLSKFPACNQMKFSQRIAKEARPFKSMGAYIITHSLIGKKKTQSKTNTHKQEEPKPKRGEQYIYIFYKLLIQNSEGQWVPPLTNFTAYMLVLYKQQM